MGKQYNRLVVEQLKGYYKTFFAEFKELKAVIVALWQSESKLIEKLHGQLIEKYSDLKERPKKNIVDNEIANAFDKLGSLNQKYKDTLREKGAQNHFTDEIKAEILEHKLNFLEKELNNKGITVKIVGGEPIFEEK